MQSMVTENGYIILMLGLLGSIIYGIGVWIFKR
jgi:hypothetical protein